MSLMSIRCERLSALLGISWKRQRPSSLSTPHDSQINWTVKQMRRLTNSFDAWCKWTRSRFDFSASSALIVQRLALLDSRSGTHPAPLLLVQSLTRDLLSRALGTFALLMRDQWYADRISHTLFELQALIMLFL